MQCLKGVVCISINVCANVYVCVCVCVYIYIYICMYVCMYVKTLFLCSFVAFSSGYWYLMSNGHIFLWKFHLPFSVSPKVKKSALNVWNFMFCMLYGFHMTCLLSHSFWMSKNSFSNKQRIWQKSNFVLFDFLTPQLKRVQIWRIYKLRRFLFLWSPYYGLADAVCCAILCCKGSYVN